MAAFTSAQDFLANEEAMRQARYQQMMQPTGNWRSDVARMVGGAFSQGIQDWMGDTPQQQYAKYQAGQIGREQLPAGLQRAMAAEEKQKAERSAFAKALGLEGVDLPVDQLGTLAGIKQKQTAAEAKAKQELLKRGQKEREMAIDAAQKKRELDIKAARLAQEKKYKPELQTAWRRLEDGTSERLTTFRYNPNTGYTDLQKQVLADPDVFAMPFGKDPNKKEGVSVTVNTGERQGKGWDFYRKELKPKEENARKNLVYLKTIEDQLNDPTVSVGFGQDAVTTLAKAVGFVSPEIGNRIQNLAGAGKLEMASAKQALIEMANQTGTLTDQDRIYIIKSVGSMTTNKEAFQYAVDIAQAIAKREIEVAQTYRNNDYDYLRAEDATANLPILFAVGKRGKLLNYYDSRENMISYLVREEGLSPDDAITKFHDEWRKLSGL